MNLRIIRDRRGLSTRKLGELSGVSFVNIIKMEHGQLDPRLSTLRKLAQALNVTLSELAGEQSVEQPSLPLTKRRSYGTHKKKR